MEFHVKNVETRQKNRSLFGRNVQSLTTATVVFPGHGFLGVSRWQDETAWVVDARFGENGFPHWSNGEGSRCTSVTIIDHGTPVEDELNSLVCD